MSATQTGFLAKYDSKCLTCGLAIHAGHDLITPIRGLKFAYRHADDCMLAHHKSEMRRFMDAGADYATLRDMLTNEVRSGRMDGMMAMHVNDYVVVMLAD